MLCYFERANIAKISEGKKFFHFYLKITCINQENELILQA